MNRHQFWLTSLHLIRFGQTPDGTSWRWLRAKPFTWREQRAVRQRHKGWRNTPVHSCGRTARR